jgi:ABC-type sulfate transport system permease subunit
MPMQTRTQSAIEIAVNYVIGFILAWFINRYVLRWMGYPIKSGQTTVITLLFTVASVIRSYGLRRLFNWLHHR